MPLLQGFINVNKPAGMTAHDVVARMRKILRVKQVGHAGTLDPLATGVLPIAVGKACRLLRFLDGTKVYRAEILLGTITTTDDLEGEVLSKADASLIPAPDVVRDELMSFVGIQEQLPPLYSAIHVQGRRLYEMARAGETPPEIPVRQVHVHSIEILENAPPKVVVRISCAAGTYIRSIARDLGERLGCGGCLAGLVREGAGPFALGQAKTLEEAEQLGSQLSGLAQLIQDPAPLLSLPAIVLTQEQARAICLGQIIRLADSSVFSATQATESQSLKGNEPNSAYVMLCYNEQLIAIGQAENISGTMTVKPEVVIRDGKDIG